MFYKIKAKILRYTEYKDKNFEAYMFSTRIKILVGYALLAIVLLSATWMVYDNTRSLSAVNHASERFMARRDIVDSLVFSMLETANAERSVLLTRGSQITTAELTLAMGQIRTDNVLQLHDEDTERQRIITALQQTNGNKAKAARLLGVDRKTIYNKIEKLGI